MLYRTHEKGFLFALISTDISNTDIIKKNYYFNLAGNVKG